LPETLKKLRSFFLLFFWNFIVTHYLAKPKIFLFRLYSDL
jgi:hypothetical protein